MDELFPAETVLMDSPRLAWMKKHGARTFHSPHVKEAPWIATFVDSASEGLGVAEVVCHRLNNHGEDSIGYGETEDDAIKDAAIKWRIPLWNEENA